MTSKEIKKAWERMKKDLKKEFPETTQLHRKFVMNYAQIANRTATFVAVGATPYDEAIEITEHMIGEIDHVYSPEYREEVHHNCRERINRLEEKKSVYGTPLKETEHLRDMIKNSKAFERFTQAVGETTLTIEVDSENYYKIRFHY